MKLKKVSDKIRNNKQLHHPTLEKIKLKKLASTIKQVLKQKNKFFMKFHAMKKQGKMPQSKSSEFD